MADTIGKELANVLSQVYDAMPKPATAAVRVPFESLSGHRGRLMLVATTSEKFADKLKKLIEESEAEEHGRRQSTTPDR